MIIIFIFIFYGRLLTVLESATGVGEHCLPPQAHDHHFFLPLFSSNLLEQIVISFGLDLNPPFPSCMSNHWDGAQINLCQSPI